MLGIRFTNENMFCLALRGAIERLVLIRAIANLSTSHSFPESERMATRIVDEFYAASGERITIPCYLTPHVPLVKTTDDELAILELDITVFILPIY